MLDKYNYHHNQYSYHAINRVIIIASHGLRAGQLRETVWHSQGLVWEPFTALGPFPIKSTGCAWQIQIGIVAVGWL